MKSLWFIVSHHVMTLFAVIFFSSVSVTQIVIPQIPPEVILSKVLESATKDLTPCQQACKGVASRYAGIVFLGQTGDFEFWDAKQAEVVPACRIEPSSSDELSWIMKEIVHWRCHFAIKSGGHERTPGASNADKGITIDMVRFNLIKLAKDKKSVTIGAGLRWADVYETLEKDQLMVLGGRISDVGVGGLLLGGGISFFSNERGLACDSVISYDLVLPNASVVSVDKQSQPQLYRALRGAGASNFGIVTSFTLETFPLLHREGIWTGQKLFSWDERHKLSQANYETVTKMLEVDSGVHVMNIYACHPDYGLCFGALMSQHTKHDSVERWPDGLAVYDRIKGMDGTTSMYISPVSNITRNLADSAPSGKYRTIYGVFTHAPSAELESRILDIFREEMYSVRDMVGFLPGVIMHPFSSTMIAKMRKDGGNAMQQVAEHTGPLIIVNVSWQWLEMTDDERAYASYARLISRAEEAAKAFNLWHPYKYVNYAEASQDVWGGYGENSVAELKRLQSEIDPLGIYAKGGLAGGPHKLNEVSSISNRNTINEQVSWDKSEL